jgi:hypothetical protein
MIIDVPQRKISPWETGERLIEPEYTENIIDALQIRDKFADIFRTSVMSSYGAK